MSTKAADFSLILKLLAGIVIGSLAGTYLGAHTESPLHCIMDAVVSLRYIFGQIIFFLVPLVIVGFITPAIVRLGQNASKILFTAVAIAYLSSIGRWDHAIHIWDKKNVLYIEAGFIYAESDDNGLIMRTLVAMGINKTDRSFPIIIKESHEYYEEALRNLINDTVDALVSEYGYSRTFQVYDAEKFERRFNGSCHMVLDEKGERLDSDYKVIEPNGSLIFSQVPAAVVDYLI